MSFDTCMLTHFIIIIRIKDCICVLEKYKITKKSIQLKIHAELIKIFYEHYRTRQFLQNVNIKNT